jgi:hypothetical protein
MFKMRRYCHAIVHETAMYPDTFAAFNTYSPEPACPLSPFDRFFGGGQSPVFITARITSDHSDHSTFSSALRDKQITDALFMQAGVFLITAIQELAEYPVATNVAIP